MYALFFLPLVPTLGLFFAGRPFEAGVFLSTAEVFLCCGEDLLPLLFILFLWCFGMAERDLVMERDLVRGDVLTRDRVAGRF